MVRSPRRWGAIALGWLAFLASAAHAQLDDGATLQSLSGQPAGEVVQVSARFTLESAERGKLAVTARINSPWHIFSLTQARGGPIASRIKVDASPQFKLAGEFRPDQPPRSTTNPDIWPDLKLETHEGTVTWTAPIELAAGVDPQGLVISGAVFAQACATSCLPPKNHSFAARLADRAATPAPAAAAGEPAEPLSQHARLSGRVESLPNGVARLRITVEPDSGWHIYELSPDGSKRGISMPTVLGLVNSSGLRYQPPSTDQKAVPRPDNTPEYVGAVSLDVKLDLNAALPTQSYSIEGLLGFQVCSEGACDLPTAARFTASFTPQSLAKGPTPVTLRKAKYGQAKALVASAAAPAGQPDAGQAAASAPADAATLWITLGLAVAGGLILNLMPCVLPVVGLKILTFVQQAGQDRRRVLALNLWYSAGVIAVFLALATLAAVMHRAWGTQFQSTAFNVVLCGVVLAMALSFLGFWEIPIPGFVGASAASQAAKAEGPSGAFVKGMISTVLATPCSGPFLGPVFAYALSQPGPVIYAIFGCIGLGMALPYLLIGAFPALVAWLPKPGAWMDTFKESMGLVLLGTILFIFPSIHSDYRLFTLGLGLGVATGCWWIGRTPLTAELPAKLRTWLQGLTGAAAIGLFSFILLAPSPAVLAAERTLSAALTATLIGWALSWWIGRKLQPAAAPRTLAGWGTLLVLPATLGIASIDSLMPRYELAWQPFTRAELARLRAEGKTVMVDFSAEWCQTCKFNKRFVIDTRPVKQFVEAHGVVPLYADWTDGAEEVTVTLDELQSKSIPVLAIYAPSQRQPIVLRDLLTQGQLLEALGQARSGAAAASTAMRQ